MHPFYDCLCTVTMTFFLYMTLPHVLSPVDLFFRAALSLLSSVRCCVSVLSLRCSTALLLHCRLLAAVCFLLSPSFSSFVLSSSLHLSVSFQPSFSISRRGRALGCSPNVKRSTPSYSPRNSRAR
ncbi:hypothetical protein AcV5_004420 [Taiwanofungus camphoratus]|nr:hypothetical protein AcW2_000985 [Antrodia cinnamomea]KAI0936229.1 hypothetical protein AcV5_004420 [Antrodia cinnamomea]KAI0961442.1 hypothetical protein AcV7_000541 [Antrodia cinnamomea]